MAHASPKERFDAAVKVIQSLPKNGKCYFVVFCQLLYNRVCMNGSDICLM